MGILDHHYKNYLPSVWSTDGNDLTARFKAQLTQQLENRFPQATAVYLVGDAVSHYWTPQSDVDILVRTPEELLSPYDEEAQLASGYPLVNTENRVYYYPLVEDMAPEVVAKHFGPLYDVGQNRWYGIRVTDKTELARPDGIIEYINWRLFKMKESDDPEPYDWKVLLLAFGEMRDGAREIVLSELKYRVARIDHNIGVLLRNRNSKTWKQVEHTETELWEEGELPSSAEELPKALRHAVLHKHRYRDIMDELETLDDKIRTRATRPKTADVTDDRVAANINQRLSNLISLLIQRNGGYGAAVDTVYDLFDNVLERNRYLGNEIRRRRIVQRLYRKYWQRKV
jgi:predicted nucleotidyltransferase